MFYLRTGANGACKSLFTLRDVRDLQVQTGRPVCVIVGDDVDPARQYVKIKPEIMAEFGWTTCQFKDWWDQPDGTIFFGDECHNYLPKRASSSASPKHISRLAEHRARGFDFFLLTQHPMNIDEFVRRLVGAPGWHQHLKRVFGGTNVTSVLQWDAVNPQCEKNRSGKSAQVVTRMQPREVYAWYDSATLHTAKVRIPKQLWYLVGALVVVPALAYFAYKRVVHPTVPGGVSSDAGLLATGGPSGGSSGERKPIGAREFVASYRPRVAGLLHTAPAYDKLTEPKRVPVPAACVQSTTRGCKCYTQDATPYPVDLAMCEQLVEHGAFLAFQPEGERYERSATAVPVRREAVQPVPPAAIGLTVMGDAPGPVASAPEPAAEVPQRIASVKR